MKFLIALALILSILMMTGCSEKIVYVNNCPKLQSYEVAPLDENITYEVYDD